VTQSLRPRLQTSVFQHEEARLLGLHLAAMQPEICPRRLSSRLVGRDFPHIMGWADELLSRPNLLTRLHLPMTTGLPLSLKNPKSRLHD
jgi:hypothetical protein